MRQAFLHAAIYSLAGLIGPLLFLLRLGLVHSSYAFSIATETIGDIAAMLFPAWILGLGSTKVTLANWATLTSINVALFCALSILGVIAHRLLPKSKLFYIAFLVVPIAMWYWYAAAWPSDVASAFAKAISVVFWICLVVTGSLFLRRQHRSIDQ